MHTRSASWDPAGDRIAFSWLRQTGTAGYFVISVVRSSGGGFTTLTDDGAERHDLGPSWSP